MNTDIRLFTDEEIKAMGKRIQSARKKKGFKSIEFADIIGIGKDQLSRIENGKVPCKVEYLFVMVELLDVSSDYLLYGKKDRLTEISTFLESLSEIDIVKAEKILKTIFDV